MTTETNSTTVATTITTAMDQLLLSELAALKTKFNSEMSNIHKVLTTLTKKLNADKLVTAEPCLQQSSPNSLTPTPAPAPAPTPAHVDSKVDAKVDKPIETPVLDTCRDACADRADRADRADICPDRIENVEIFFAMPELSSKVNFSEFIIKVFVSYFENIIRFIVKLVSGLFEALPMYLILFKVILLVSPLLMRFCKRAEVPLMCSTTTI